MRSSSGNGNEQEAGLNGARFGGLCPSSAFTDGHIDVHRPERNHSWEVPHVPGFPDRRNIALTGHSGTRNVERLAEKICVLGNSGVGKTSLVRRYAQDRFDDDYITTCGARVTVKKIRLDYPERNLQSRLSVQIWDVSGEHGRSLNPAFFRGASGALVVGDAVRLETQLDLWKWIEDFRAVAGNVPVMIVVNKSDIMDRQEFDYLLMDDLSKEYGCIYTMTSARHNDRVDEAFRTLCQSMVRRRLEGSREGAGAC
jgi:small GTP-binding protein